VSSWAVSKLRLAFALVSLLLLPLTATTQEASISSGPKSEYVLKYAGSGEAMTVQVTGVSAKLLKRLNQAQWNQDQWQKLLSIRVVQENIRDEIGLPAVSGTYRIENSIIEFKPQFPFTAGVKYVAAFQPRYLPDPPASQMSLSLTFELPAKKSSPSTIIADIFPSGDVVPENLLKFYLHFSAPMSRGHIYDHIQLLNEKGAPVELPFLEIDEELWNNDLTRLTLFLDPGRIKRGVKPLEEIGPALETGRSYTLVIRPTWHDAAGNPLMKGFEKKFHVGPVDREPIDPARWTLQLPESSTRDALTIDFHEPLDHALALRMIRFIDAKGRAIRGNSKTEAQESKLVFTPEETWKAGEGTMAIETTIEDLAGNNIGKPFEVDVFEKVQQRVTNEVVKIPFQIN
jgi:hypothetical protein